MPLSSLMHRVGSMVVLRQGVRLQSLRILYLALQTDPSLARTVVVSTKLDTRIPQFARGQDVELFLHPPGRQLEPSMLGGSPFFTCAPLGSSRHAPARPAKAIRERCAWLHTCTATSCSQQA